MNKSQKQHKEKGRRERIEDDTCFVTGYAPFFWAPKCICVLSEGPFSHSDPSWMWTKYPAPTLPKCFWTSPNVAGFKPVPSVSPSKVSIQKLHWNWSPGAQQENNDRSHPQLLINLSKWFWGKKKNENALFTQ